MFFTSIEKLQLYQLLISLSIGLLIGLERGWHRRESQTGEHIAGIRTYGLLGLLGGSCAILANTQNILLMGLFFIGLSIMLITIYVIDITIHRKDMGTTSLIAALLAFILGALASIGQETIASATAVVTTLVLGYKSSIHRLINKLDASELHAILQLLLISVLILPLLPNETYDPWHALNPYEIWLMVVLIATISFMGYFALKIGGPRRGAAFTGLFSGMVSSTALTLSFARIARHNPAIQHELSAGILIACAIMLPRMLLLATIINNALLTYLWLPTLIMSLCLLIPAIVYLQKSNPENQTATSSISNPLELKSAILFGLFLAGIMLLSQILKNYFGDAGILILATISGIMDVDAINLSLSRMSLEDLNRQIAACGIILAAVVNNLVKAGIASMISGHVIGWRASLPLVISAGAGLIYIGWIIS
jgi:uncharacterized membrane protein (DUF4010 family)